MQWYLGAHSAAAAAERYPAIRKAAEAGRDAAIKRIQDWIALPSIAAENLNMKEGAEYMATLARDAGFDTATIVPTDGHPGVFATMDNGARRTLALYFMYDVKQFDPAEWSSPPLEGRIVDKPGFGRAIVGRGAVNQKGPEATLLAALHAMRAAKVKPPVNLVLVAEGEEEIGSPNFHQIVQRPDVLAALEEGRGHLHSRRAGRTITAASPSTSAPKASSSWSWSRAAQSGVAGPRATSTPARRRRSIRRSGASCRR